MKQSEIKNKMPLVLIVDDEPRNLQVLNSVLEENYYEVIEKTNGPDSLEILQEISPDLILLDVMMPDMDGYETCKIIKETERIKEIPVIFLTAKVEPDDIIQGFAVGGVDYITKPFNHTELLARISTHIELKKSRDALKRTEKELRVSNSSKDKFFSIIAHDLKNPFNSMLGFSSMLYEDYDDYDQIKQKEFISHIYFSIQNTYKLLEDLLLWARSQKGTIDFKPTKGKLNLFIEETYNLLNQLAQDREISLKNQIPEDLFVEADNNMLNTIVRNLVSNAIKFTAKKGTIIISAKSTTGQNNNNFIEISVKDNGIGIKDESIENLFNIATNISTKGTENETGTGLGLILCKEFVEKHGGEIWAESEVGKGSTFLFTFPAIN